MSIINFNTYITNIQNIINNKELTNEEKKNKVSNIFNNIKKNINNKLLFSEDNKKNILNKLNNITKKIKYLLKNYNKGKKEEVNLGNTPKANPENVNTQEANPENVNTPKANPENVNTPNVNTPKTNPENTNINFSNLSKFNFKKFSEQFNKFNDNKKYKIVINKKTPKEFKQELAPRLGKKINNKTKEGNDVMWYSNKNGEFKYGKLGTSTEKKIANKTVKKYKINYPKYQSGRIFSGEQSNISENTLRKFNNRICNKK